MFVMRTKHVRVEFLLDLKRVLVYLCRPSTSLIREFLDALLAVITHNEVDLHSYRLLHIPS